MLLYVLIGLGAGGASSLLYVAAGTGSLLGFVAPLPLMIAGLGWRSLASTIGAVFGTAIAAAYAGLWGGVGYALAAAVPAVWLSARALLARPRGPGDPADIEWYPVGRLLLWAGILSAVLVFVTLLTSFGEAGFERRVAALFAEALRQHGMAEAEARPVALWLARIAPPVSAVLWMLTLLFNFWAAGRIVRASGRSQRPWPDLAGVSLPPVAVPGLAAAVAALFVPGLVRAAGSVAAAVLTTAFMLVGLAVIHAVTRGRAARPVMLGALYTGLVLLPWTGFVLALVGLAEPALKLRRRRNRPVPNGPNPSPGSHPPPGSHPSQGSHPLRGPRDS